MRLDPIAERAMLFAKTFVFVNQRVVRILEPNPFTVERYGTPGSTVYKQVDVEMEWREDEIKDALTRAENAEVREFMEREFRRPTTMRITCSSTDVLGYEIVGLQMNTTIPRTAEGEAMR